MKDLYGPDFPAHGSPAGFDAGCNTRQVCTHFGSDDWMTCTEAVVAYRTDFTLGKEPRSKPIARTQPMTPPAAPKQRGGATLMAPLGTHGPKPAPAAAAAPAGTGFEPFKKSRGPYLPRDLAFDDERYPHGTEKGYKRGCRTTEDCDKNRDRDTTTGTCLAAHQATFKRPPSAADEPLDAAKSAYEGIVAQMTATQITFAAELSDDTRLETTLMAEETTPLEGDEPWLDAGEPAAVEADPAEGNVPLMPEPDTADAIVARADLALIQQLQEDLDKAREELRNAEEAGRRLDVANARLRADAEAREIAASTAVAAPQPAAAPRAPEPLALTIEPSAGGVQVSLGRTRFLLANDQSLSLSLALPPSGQLDEATLAISVGSPSEQR